MCSKCTSNKQIRYNPFNNLLFNEHDPNSLDPMEDLHELCKILDDCKYYNIKNLNNLSKSILSRGGDKFSCLCNNVDGNAANFDSFYSEILSPCSNIFLSLELLKLILIVVIKIYIAFLIIHPNIMISFRGSGKEVESGYT